MHMNLQAVAQELEQYFAAQVQIEAINGGAINSSYRVHVAGQQYFLKIFAALDALRLDRRGLFAQQRQLANVQLAPEPVYLAKAADFQVDQWLDRPTLATAGLDADANAQRLAAAISRIHRLSICLPRLDLAQDWQRYMELASYTPSQIERQQMQQLLMYWQHESALYQCPCHHDLALSHVTLAEPAVVFDWEYSAMSNPFFDLASCIAINQLSPNAQHRLLSAYAGLHDYDVTWLINKVADMLPVVNKTNQLWQLAMQQMAENQQIG